MTTSVLAGVAMAPRDPILGVTEAFNADESPGKVNLGVGVYYDEERQGAAPRMREARRARSSSRRLAPRGYLPIDGMPAYDQAVRRSSSGPTIPRSRKSASITVQTLGGTGGLKVGADFSVASRRMPTSGSASRAGRTTARSSRAPASR